MAGMFFAMGVAAVMSIQLLSAVPTCSRLDPTRAHVALSWEFREAEADRIPLMLELSILRDDFSPGPNRHAIELPAGTTEYVFEGALPPLTIFHWRVRARAGDFHSSETRSFESPSCAVGDSTG